MSPLDAHLGAADGPADSPGAPAPEAPAEVIVRSRLHGELLWRRVGTQHGWVNRRGRTVALALWQGTCVVCGSPFEITSPARARTLSHAFRVRTCPEHRLRPNEVARLFAARTAAGRVEAFAKIREHKLSQAWRIERSRDRQRAALNAARAAAGRGGS